MKSKQVRKSENLNIELVDGKGTLYLVATPIGNLDDMSIRAISTLKNVQLILAEDTRKFSILAARFDIKTPRQSYFEHNEKSRILPTINLLLTGENVALVSDAGTPGIADPGYLLVNACWENGIRVSPIPGACAAIAALAVSGFPSHRFIFEGFLPIKEGKRKSALLEILARETTTICYESPYRIVKTLYAIEAIDSLRIIFLIREISKLFEETFRSTAAEIRGNLEKRGSVKGEFALVFGENGKKRKF